jgi:hypothetical protein
MRCPRSNSTIRIVAAVALALATAACGGATATPATGDPTGGAGTAASSAASTPALEPLTQTLTAKAGGRSVKFPAGWIGTDNLGILYVVSSQAANDRLIGLGSLSAGDVFIQFSENSILSGATDDPAVHLPDYLKLLASGMGLTLPAPVAMTSAGRAGARIDAKNSKLEMIAISFKVRPDLFADIIAYVPPGEKATREPLILSIIESLEYPPA